MVANVSERSARRKRPRHVWFSSPCRVSGAPSPRASRILDGIADVFLKIQAFGCHVHFAPPLSASSWRQNSLLGMSEKMMKAVVNGCAWGLRDSQGSLLNRSWQVLTTSPDVQPVLDHRCCDKRHNTADSPIISVHLQHNFRNPCVRRWRNSFS